MADIIIGLQIFALVGVLIGSFSLFEKIFKTHHLFSTGVSTTTGAVGTYDAVMGAAANKITSYFNLVAIRAKQAPAYHAVPYAFNGGNLYSNTFDLSPYLAALEANNFRADTIWIKYGIHTMNNYG